MDAYFSSELKLCLFKISDGLKLAWCEVTKTHVTIQPNIQHYMVLPVLQFSAWKETNKWSILLSNSKYVFTINSILGFEKTTECCVAGWHAVRHNRSQLWPVVIPPLTLLEEALTQYSRESSECASDTVMLFDTTRAIMWSKPEWWWSIHKIPYHIPVLFSLL